LQQNLGRNKMIVKIILSAVASLVVSSLCAQTGVVSGRVSDRKSGESVIGASVSVEGTALGAATDVEGRFLIKGVPTGPRKIRISYLSYGTAEIERVVVAGQTVAVAVELEESAEMLGEVSVVGVQRMNTERALLQAQRASLNIVSGVSSQQIGRTQDRDASEVVRRITGISVIDNRFIVARGLAQRYNNVWINGNAVPSSEADTRSFAFDMIPSGQIENIMVYRSPTPELPADFTGGFVKITTRNMPLENMTQLSIGTNVNTKTHFDDFLYAKASRTDVLGFDGGLRALGSVVPAQRMDNSDPELVTAVTQRGFNNDWTVKSSHPLPDSRFALAVNRFLSAGKAKWGLVAALNYSRGRLRYSDMTNARFGIYNKTDDVPVCLYDYTDNQYTTSVKVGGLLNLTWMRDDQRVEFRHMLNQTANDRYTHRSGWRNVSAKYLQEKEEYLYSSRGSYAGQLSGNHGLDGGANLDWTVGYALANKDQPDRRQVEREEEMADSRYKGQFFIDHNDVIRDYNRLDEHMLSLAANYERDVPVGSVKPRVKLGIYAEERRRAYDTRYFLYRLVGKNLPEGFAYGDIAGEIMQMENFGADKLYVYDDSDQTNNYTGGNRLASGYVGVNLPVNRLNIYAGVRYEWNDMTVRSFTMIASEEKETHRYRQSDFFPSVNANYRLGEKRLLRVAYGQSINRQEFREVSPSTWYDFDLFSYVRGNRELQPAYIRNFDVCYEWYPSEGELISLAFFYKRFLHPIEWTYIDAGGTYTFTFENAERANNYGLELDVKKSLSEIGLEKFYVSLNGAVIDSKVIFGANSMEHDRPMQGQSPYMVNAGLFYQGKNVNMGLLYNTIGKRIVGIGRSNNSQGGSLDNDVPDMYEMARQVVDLSFGYRFRWVKPVELNVGIRDLLAEPLVYKQFPKFVNDEGIVEQREQTTKTYRPGRNVSIVLRVNL
jgi:outer membrane receptor for ferrienterochelin and colicin